jgi:hypothetical protein
MGLAATAPTGPAPTTATRLAMLTVTCRRSISPSWPQCRVGHELLCMRHGVAQGSALGHGREEPSRLLTSLHVTAHLGVVAIGPRRPSMIVRLAWALLRRSHTNHRLSIPCDTESYVVCLVKTHAGDWSNDLLSKPLPRRHRGLGHRPPGPLEVVISHVSICATFPLWPHGEPPPRGARA